VVQAADGEIRADREFGAFVVGGRVNFSRTSYGPTTMVGPVMVDNTHQSNWTAGTGLRVGYRVTPILTAFVDGSAGYQLYDAPSPDFLVKLDAADYEVRTGLSAAVNSTLEAEASVGVGYRNFTDPVLSDALALLYDASVTVRPDETVTMTAAFTTGFGAPGAGSGGTARLEYEATGDIAYQVNPWLALRASAGWRYALLLGTPETERGYDAGVGADYRLNEFATLTADYGYSFAETTPNPAEDAHRVSVGVTISR
jgi:hypothetical protein